MFNASDEFSMFSNSGYGPSTAVIGGFGGYEPVGGSSDSATGNGGPSRVNNSVAYASPSWGGFRVGAMGGFGEVAGDTGGNRIWDGFVRYTGGGFDAILSVDDDRGGAVTPDAQRRTWTGAAGYTLGNWRVTGGYLYMQDRSAANQSGSGAWIGMGYSFGANLVKVQYVENNPRYLDNAKTQALGLGYEYSFSKRTTLYSALTYFKNQDNAAGGNGRASFSMPANFGSADANDYTEVVAGMRFKF